MQGTRRRKLQEKQTKKSAKHASLDYVFLILVLTILTFGLVMLFSASYAYDYYHEGNSFYHISRQLVFAILGIVVMLVLSHIDYHIFIRFSLLIYAITLLCLVIVLFMRPMNGARRWIVVGPLTFQPSEIAKFAVAVMFARWIELYSDKMKTFRFGIVPFIVILLPIVGLMVIEPHLSGTILVLLMAMIMMIVGGANLKWFGVAAIAGCALIAVVVMIPGVIPYAMSRIQYWIDPFSDAQGKGFQTIQSLYAIGTGGLMGRGLGQSRQKHLYIPEPHNDFVFSIVCEELGFVGATLIIILFVLLVWRGYVIAMRAKDKFGAILAIGLTSQVGIQALLNIAVVTNTIPNTGISMPFFSSGGTSLVMLLAEMGIILSVSRSSTLEKE